MERKAVEPDRTESMVKAVGERVRELRTLEGMTMEEMAGAIGRTRQQIWAIETGRIPNLTLDAIIRTGNALGYDVEVTFKKRW